MPVSNTNQKKKESRYMKCNHCGHENPENAAFCAECGSKLVRKEPQPPRPIPPRPTPPTPRPDESQSVGLAVASMVCGICSLVLACCVPYVPFVLALIGVILGGVSLSGHRGGKGMAIAGLVTSIISLIPAVMVVLAGASLLASAGFM